MNMYNWKIIFILQIILMQHIQGETQQKRDYYFGFSRMQCSHNSSAVMKEFSCSLRSSFNRTDMLDAYFIFNEPINTFDVHIIINLYPKHLRRWTLLNVRTNGCEFLKIIHRQTFFRIFIRTFNKYMNVKEFQCPLKKNFNYTVTGFKYDENDFPSYVPEGQVQGLAYMLVENKQIAFLTVWGYVKYFGETKG